MNILRIGILASSLCLAGAAVAQDVQFGVQGGVNIPFGNLGDALDNRPGIQVGGHAGIYYGNGHELRPRLDFTYYQGGYFPGVHDNLERNTISAWGLGCDYVYYTEMRPQGFYLTMGLGYQWWTVSPREGSDTTNSSLSMAAGAGYRFNRSFSLEGRFTTGQFRSDNGQANALQAVASLRF